MMIKTKEAQRASFLSPPSSVHSEVFLQVVDLKYF